MEKIDIELTDLISNIRYESHHSKLDDSLFERLDQPLGKLASFFDVNKVQAFLIANMYYFFNSGRRANINDLSKYFSCDVEKLRDYVSDMDELVEKGLFNKRKLRITASKSARYSYELEESIGLAISVGHPIPRFVPSNYDELLDVLDRVYFSIEDEREFIPFSMDKLFGKMNKILVSNKHIPFLKKVKEMGFAQADTYLFLYLCREIIIGYFRTDIIRTIKFIYNYPAFIVPYAKQLLANENELLKSGWIEIEESSLLQDSKIKLSKKAIEFLHSENIPMFSWKAKSSKIIPFSLDQAEPFNVPLKDQYFGKAKRWAVKIKSLSLEECNLLVNNFDFTEEQIGIISLKCEYQISLGRPAANIHEVIEYCRNEAIRSENRFRRCERRF